MYRFIISRKFSTKLNIYEKLTNRNLLKINGDEGLNFLQGLITNDVKFLVNKNNSSIYCLFLNQRGLIIFDSVIYNLNNEFFIEHDSRHTDLLIKHINMYKLRKKIDLIDLKDNYDLYWINRPSSNLNENLFIDARISELGYKIIVPKDTDIKNKLNDFKETTDEYKQLRYNLGVAEGVEEIPFDKCYPFEYNADYLHAVSFHKGCYIGQELTARVYHTGVIRKRIMPLYFNENKDEDEVHVQDQIIYSSENLKLGKLRAIYKNVGLALLKIEQSLKAKHLLCSNRICHTKLPTWWPKH